jgi:ribonuclease-3
MAARPAQDLKWRLDAAEKIVGHRFADRSLLLIALTHPSAIDDGDPSRCYERLEFLGDAIVGAMVAEEVYRRFPRMPEGGMTLLKISVVSGSTLARLSESLGLDELIIFGSSERGTGGRGLTSALENVYEAICAALYLDAGLEVAKGFILRTVGVLISEEAALAPDNPKSRLQEYAQAHGDVPTYRIVSEEGPPHDRTFTAEVEVPGVEPGRGVGRSKKEAEAAAAGAVLDNIEGTTGPACT